MKRTPFRTATAVSAAAVLALSLAACGSDDKRDDDTKSEPSTLSAAEFKTQANALCKTANAEIATIEQGLAAATTEADATAAVTSLVDRVDELVGAIKDLDEPADLSDDVDAMLAAVTTVSDDIKSQGLDYFKDQTGDPFADADAKATALGLTDCAGNE